MLDNLLYLLQETFLPWYLMLWGIQFVLLWFAKHTSKKQWWVALYLVIGVSFVLSLIALAVFGSSGGFTYLADSFVSFCASMIFAGMFWVANVIKD